MTTVDKQDFASLTASDSESLPGVKVAAARRLIVKPPDLKEVAEGKLLGVRALAWRMHTFEGDDEATRLAEILAVDLSGTEPVALGVVEISWTYIIRQLQIGAPDEWQVGVLTVNAKQSNRVELAPPPDSVDLERVATMLGGLALAAPAEQLALPVGSTNSDNNHDDFDDDPPFKWVDCYRVA
jgi:hypothetical protein